MSDPLDQKQMFFVNLQLLGFDADAMAAKNNVPFNKNMFDLPNKKGAEIVLHFLFSRLNPIMCREEFRDCWPVDDKSREQQFRRTCHNWLTNIAKSEPDAHLPRIVASLFMAPGGDKFYNVLLHFSRHVLNQVIHAENGVKDHEQLKYPQWSQQNASLCDVIAKYTECSVVRSRKQFLEESQTTLVLNQQWKDFSSELVKDYRKLCKDTREMEHRRRVDQQRALEHGTARGSVVARRRRSDSFDYEFDSQSVKRTQRLQQVRDMWKQLNDFCSKEAEERAVIKSIVDRTLIQHKIDAGEINVKVPDLLLRECEQEIRRVVGLVSDMVDCVQVLALPDSHCFGHTLQQRHVDNTFHSGKLNLVSLIQLWNLCLHLYIERLHQDGVPDFTDELGNVSKLVHTNHAYLSNSKTLKKQISDILPELQMSVDKLRTTVEDQIFKSTSPTSIRTTSVGFGLVESSPSFSFTPGQGSSGVTPKQDTLQQIPVDEQTPEAAGRILEVLATQGKRGPVKLFQGYPEYAPRMDVSAASSKSGAARNQSSTSSKLPRKRAAPPERRHQLQSTPTNTVKTVSRTKPSPRSVDVRHLIHGTEMNTNSNSKTKSSKLLEASHINTSEEVLQSPARSQNGVASQKQNIELSPSDIIVNQVLNESGDILSTEREEPLEVNLIDENPKLTLEESLGSFSSRSFKSDRSHKSGVNSSRSPRSQKSPKGEPPLRQNSSIISVDSEHSSCTLVNSHKGNESVDSRTLGESFTSVHTLVESVQSVPGTSFDNNDIKTSPMSNRSNHSHLSESQQSTRSLRSGVMDNSQRNILQDVPVLRLSNAFQNESPRSVTSVHSQRSEVSLPPDVSQHGSPRSITSVHSQRSKASLPPDVSQHGSPRSITSVHSQRSKASLPPDVSQHGSPRSITSVHSQRSKASLPPDVSQHGSPRSITSVHSQRSNASLHESAKSHVSEVNHSPRSELSQPSGVFDDVQDNLSLLSVCSDSGNDKMDKSGSSSSGEQSRKRKDSFTLELPPPIQPESDYSVMEQSEGMQFTPERPTSPVAETLNDLDVIKRKLDELKAKANQGWANDMLSGTFDATGYTLPPSQNLAGSSHRSAPVQKSGLQQDLSASSPAKLISLMEEKTKNPQKSPASPLTQEMKSLWKEVLMDTEDRSQGVTPRSRQNLSRSFSNITEQMEGLSLRKELEKDIPGETPVPTDDFRVQSSEKLEDIQPLNLLLMNTRDLVNSLPSTPKLSSAGNTKTSTSIRRQDFNDTDLLRSGSLGDKVYEKPHFPQTEFSTLGGDREILVSLTPHTPMTNSTLLKAVGKYPVTEEFSINNRNQNSGVADLFGLSGQGDDSADSEIHFNYKSQDQEDLKVHERSKEDSDKLKYKSLQHSSSEIKSSMGTPPFFTEVPPNDSSETGLFGASSGNSDLLKGQPWGIVDDDEQGLDDVEILDVELDDSFVPLKDGFKLERGTPMQESSRKRDNGESFTHDLIDTHDLLS